MKLLTYEDQDQIKVGVLCEENQKVYALSDLGWNFRDMNEVIEKLDDESKMKIARQIKELEDCDKGRALSEVILKAPIIKPKQDIICLGLNYMEHARESEKVIKEDYVKERKKAVYFSKRVNEAVAPNGKILSHPDLVKDLDYEVELGVIIGKDAYQVKASEARSYIFGYTIINDVSARTLQLEHGQWYFGKSLDGFTPMGPWIVTEDEISFPVDLELKCLVSGELRQCNRTTHMIFKIEEIIEELSAGMTLEAGTIIATGTPSGVGMAMNPPYVLKSGDEVVCIIEKIGELKNEVE